MTEKGLLKEVFASLESLLNKLTERVHAARNGAALEDLNLTVAGLSGAEEYSAQISRLCQTLNYLHRQTQR